VRRARRYFVNIAAGIGAPLVHSGSSRHGYGAMAASGLSTVDGIVGEGGFHRHLRRPAPHNACTSVNQARASVKGAWPQSEAKSRAVRGSSLPGQQFTAPLAPRPWALLR
jgi:hypothetical protein